MSSYLGSPQNLTSFHSSLDGINKRRPFEGTSETVKRKKGDSPSYPGASFLVRTPSYGSPSEAQTEDSLSNGTGDFDQRDEDELSKIEWSRGRRRTAAGLLTCLYDRRRERATTPLIKPPRKKVRFVSDEKLVKTKFFEMDDEERANVYRAKLLAEEQGIDLKQLSADQERKCLEQAAQNELNHHQESADENPWFSPPPIVRLPAPLVDRGSHSVEKLVFHARQMTTLSALFLNRENLPDSPEEPTESLPVSDAKNVPLIRAGMNMKQPLPAEIIASGPLPDVPELPSVPTPPVVPFVPQPTAGAPVQHPASIPAGNGYNPAQLSSFSGSALSLDIHSKSVAPAQRSPLAFPGYPDVAHSYPPLSVPSSTPAFMPISAPPAARPPYLPTTIIDSSFRAQGANTGIPAFQPSFNVPPHNIPKYQTVNGHLGGSDPYPVIKSSAPGSSPGYQPPQTSFPFPSQNTRQNGPAPPVRYESNGFRPYPTDNASRPPGQHRLPNRVCQYHSLPGGCRNGNSCRFLHTSARH